EEISPENVRLSISFQLNGKPRLAKKGEVGWMGSDPRYLSGTLVAEPGLMSREVILQIRDIIVPGKKVPVEFIERMSPYRIAERYVGSEGIGTTMAKLTKVEIGEGVIRFHKTAGEEPEDAVTNAEVDSASRRFFSVLAIAACIFPLIVGIILFVGMRLKKSKERTV
ncbi:MAG: hypothetical protein H7Y36_00110, partial [Armatimonadetes bacterium]|nr:hypothetical protein [Akkermansiaceae bacterium]